MADHGFWNYAQREPDALALIDPSGRKFTRGELLAECNKLVGGLRTLGLEHGDVVAINSPNCAEYYMLALACTQAGFYLTPINWHLAPAEVAYIVKDCGAKAFIGHERVGKICTKAADEIAFPTDARFAIGAIDGFRPFSDLGEGQSAVMPANRFRSISTAIAGTSADTRDNSRS